MTVADALFYATETTVQEEDWSLQLWTVYGSEDWKSNWRKRWNDPIQLVPQFFQHTQTDTHTCTEKNQIKFAPSQKRLEISPVVDTGVSRTEVALPCSPPMAIHGLCWAPPHCQQAAPDRAINTSTTLYSLWCYAIVLTTTVQTDKDTTNLSWYFSQLPQYKCTQTSRRAQWETLPCAHWGTQVDTW